MTVEFPTGAFIDPAVTDATIVSLIADGRQPVCGENATIKGAWGRAKARGVKAILLPKLMQKYYPKRAADLQDGSRNAHPARDEGTCVARGAYRAAMLSYLRQIDEHQLVGRPAVLAYEPLYAGSRVTIGKGRLGSGGGSYGAWVSEFLSRYGACERNRYGTIDLSVDSPVGRTDLAAAWGRPSAGPPAVILDACRQHPFDAHNVRNVTEQMDCLASGFAGGFARSSINGARDKYGMSRPERSGGHQECAVGVFVAHNGEDAVLMQQSWGSQPGGTSVLTLHGGETWPLPQGCYGIMAGDQQSVWRSGAEGWHYECREGGQWR